MVGQGTVILGVIGNKINIFGNTNMKNYHSAKHEPLIMVLYNYWANHNT